MAPDLGGWIHNFTVTDTQTHKGGYTLYKITSVVFPRYIPQALTQIVVWRRFHDVKRLHRDLKRRYKGLQLSGHLPEPIDSSFFKRFDMEVIQRRKEYILQLLDYAAQHAVLYKCNAFVQFFNETSPTNKMRTLVHKAIRGLNLNIEIMQDQVDSVGRELSDKKKSTIIDDELFLAHQQEVKQNSKEGEENVDLYMADGDEENDADDSLKVEYTSNVNKHPKHFLTPMASIESDDRDYIYDAALEFSQAVQAEANLEYLEAHTRYKKGVDVLLYGSKDDNNEERKYIARAKISKYLARADDIHERFLKSSNRVLSSSPKNNFQLSIDVAGNTTSHSLGLYLERPWSHMAKYKVNCLLGDKVLHVTCITEPLKPSYVMKGIEKPSSNSPTQTVFLPQHVPYMVDLLTFFQSDQKIFLLLQLASGGKLIDYVHTLNNPSYKTHHFCKMNVNGKSLNSPKDTKTVLEVNNLVNNSKQLLQSVSNTLQAIKDLESPTKSPYMSFAKSSLFHLKFPQDKVKMWSQQLLIVIQALHEKSVILCDMNVDNLLLNENCQLLLTYFYQNEGVSSDSCIHKALSTKALDEHFVAPERPLTFRSDWWSYGVILYELFLGLPFKAAHPGQIDLYGFVQYPETLEISDTAKDLLENLLQQVPEKRLDYEKIKQHRYFDGINWEEMKQNGYNKFSNK